MPFLSKYFADPLRAFGSKQKQGHRVLVGQLEAAAVEIRWPRLDLGGFSWWGPPVVGRLLQWMLEVRLWLRL